MIMPPVIVSRAAMYHLSGAMCQLRSYDSKGPTVYALTVFGIKGERDLNAKEIQIPDTNVLGAASLAGPALNFNGLTTDWPPVARDAARSIFDSSDNRMAGAIIVITIVQIGHITHAALINVPSASRYKQ